MFIHTSDKRCYSNDKKGLRKIGTDVSFSEGHVVRMETHEGELVLINETLKIEFRTRIELTDEEWNLVGFFVRLYTAEDSISIIK